MQCSRQIGQELAIIVKQSQVRLQLCDIGRTLGLHDCIHLLREGTNAILVNPVSERPDWKKAPENFFQDCQMFQRGTPLKSGFHPNGKL